MDNNEPTIESLREEIAAKDSALAEMNAAAETAAKEYENAKAEFAKQLAEKDAALAAAEAQFADARTRWEADTLAARKAAEDAAANAKAEFTKQLADKDAEIASLKAAAKTAEQIAAEKYGAALKPESVPAPGGAGLSPEEISKLVANAKDDPRAFARLAKDLSKEQIRRMRA